MKPITKIERIGTGKSIVRFNSPITTFEYFTFLVSGIGLTTLSSLTIKETNSLISNILILIPGIIGLLAVGHFIELVGLSTQTLTINHQVGTLTFNFLSRKSQFEINQVSHVLVKKHTRRGIIYAQGYAKTPDSISHSLHLVLKNGKSIGLIHLNGIPVVFSNAKGRLSEQSKSASKKIAHLLSVKVVTE